jgi:diguanylate cyclase (GGDEF)-like protein
MGEDPRADRTDGAVDPLTIDALTGLTNEHLFRLRFPAELRQARDREANAALLVVRPGNIVAINEQHGRAAGDDTLRAVAHVLEGCRAAPGRESHVAVRLGGPLFGYYAPICSAPQARAIAEEILGAAREPGRALMRPDVSVAIVNLHEYFLDDGTDAQIAESIEREALARLAVAEARGGNTICDSSQGAMAATRARPSVLIVEPELASLQMLASALEAGDLTVRVCGDGETAMTLIQSDTPQVVIAAAMAPRLNGFELRERLRTNALWAAIPYILVSHKKNEDLVRRAVDLDIRHYFRKPLSIVEVAGLVSNLTRDAARQRPTAQRPDPRGPAAQRPESLRPDASS